MPIAPSAFSASGGKPRFAEVSPPKDVVLLLVVEPMLREVAKDVAAWSAEGAFVVALSATVAVGVEPGAVGDGPTVASSRTSSSPDSELVRVLGSRKMKNAPAATATAKHNDTAPQRGQLQHRLFTVAHRRERVSAQRSTFAPAEGAGRS